MSHFYLEVMERELKPTNVVEDFNDHNELTQKPDRIKQNYSFFKRVKLNEEANAMEEGQYT